MSWINTIDLEDAKGKLKQLYEQIKTPDGHIDNIMRVHSLRPRTMEAHLSLYKASLHSRPSGLSYRERELVGVCVSLLNGCDYCVAHHTAGLARHLGDAKLAERLTTAAVSDDPGAVLDEREQALAAYAIKLTRQPGNMTAEDVEALRGAGLDDAAILDLNQVVAYFAYANRTVTGLGVSHVGEPLGLHPSEDVEGYRHA